MSALSGVQTRLSIAQLAQSYANVERRSLRRAALIAATPLLKVLEVTP